MKRDKSWLLITGCWLLVAGGWLGAEPVRGQGRVGASLDGYLSNMQSVMFRDVKGNWMNDNLVHNRLNFSLYAGNHLQLKVEMRNRFMFGETVKYMPGYADLLERDQGYLDLTLNLLSDSSYILNSTIDRVFLDFSLGSLQVTGGRQRINWGMNYVWNPNDIFNSYSFFDFDYIEKPGCDALRLQYFFGTGTHAELVTRLNHDQQYSLAALMRFNLKGFDYQILGAFLDEQEWVFGGGFSGYWGPVSLTGEVSFLHPAGDVNDHPKAMLAGLGAAYQTPFNLMLQAEYLYNQAADNLNTQSFSEFYHRELSIRDLSPSVHTLFGNLSYPFTPLVNLGIAGMVFTSLKGFYAGPSLDLSINQNIDLSFIGQYFRVSFDGNAEEHATLGFLRLKWSF